MHILQNRKGVTLLEGLIALALLAMIVVGTFGVLLSSSRKTTAPDKREEMVLAAERIRHGMQILAYQMDNYTPNHSSYNATDTNASYLSATYPLKPGYMKNALAGEGHGNIGMDTDFGFWNYLFNMGRGEADPLCLSGKTQCSGTTQNVDNSSLAPVVCNSSVESQVKISTLPFGNGSNRMKENLFWYDGIPNDDATGLKEMYDLYRANGVNGLVSSTEECKKTGLIIRNITIECDREG